jgi:hypothetical protein
MRLRAAKGAVPETALDAGDRKATIADAIAAPGAAKNRHLALRRIRQEPGCMFTRV